MLPILTTPQIKEIDHLTIQKYLNGDSWALMEKAAEAFSRRFITLFGLHCPTIVLAGSGNNGGDGLAIARILHSWGVVTSVYLAQPEKEGSSDYYKNKFLVDSRLFLDKNQLLEWPNNKESGIVIDAIFGSGLSRRIAPPLSDLINEVNTWSCTRVAVDIASGLMADQPSPKESPKVKANYTITFETPHLAFFIPENEPFVGKWYLESIGWKKSDWSSVFTNYYFSEAIDFAGILPERSKFTHKGDIGRGTLLAGSRGKAGAAILASRAALRSGVGLLTVHTCQTVGKIIQRNVPEAMVDFEDDDSFIKKFNISKKYDACAIGPGLGLEEETQLGFYKYANNLNIDAKYILDADALSILSNFPNLISFFSEKTWITPHVGECDRLLGRSENSFDRLKRFSAFCQMNKLSGVLKGAFSACVSTDGIVYFNCSGNPGMATGGSGDVLTGIMLAIALQIENPLDVMRTSVYIHGLAGDLAARKLTEISMLPSDIIDFLPSAFNAIYCPKR